MASLYSMGVRRPMNNNAIEIIAAAPAATAQAPATEQAPASVPQQGAPVAAAPTAADFEALKAQVANLAQAVATLADAQAAPGAGAQAPAVNAVSAGAAASAATPEQSIQAAADAAWGALAPAKDRGIV